MSWRPFYFYKQNAKVPVEDHKNHTNCLRKKYLFLRHGADFKIMIKCGGSVNHDYTQYHLTPIRMAVITNKNKN